MPHTTGIKQTFIVILIVGGVVPIVGGYLLGHYFPDWYLEQHPLHAVIEAFGAITALIIASFILVCLASRRLNPFYLWLACGLIAMGVLDGFHASHHPGEEFVWFHSLAIFVGGLLFALVWLPESAGRGRVAKNLPVMFLIISIATGIVSIAYPSFIPAMVSNGDFTFSTQLLNFSGGVGFIAAASFFFLNSNISSPKDRIVFSTHALLFGVAGLMFEFSQLWDAPWWLWHGMRLAAYMVVAYYILTLFMENEQQLKQAHEDLAHAQSVAHLGHYYLNIQTGKWINSAELNEIFGIDENFQRDIDAWQQIIHPEHREIMSQYLQDYVFKQRQEFNKEYKIISIKTRQEKWVHGLGRLIFDDDNRPIRMFGTIQDITTQKVAEELLRQSEERFREFSEINPLSIQVLDHHGRVTFCNSAHTSLTGYTPEESIGKGIWEFVKEDGRQEIQEFIEYLVENQPQPKPYISQNQKKDGSLIDVQTNWTYRRDRAGKVSGFLSITRDITEQNKFELLLREARSDAEIANKSKSEFLANMSHDLRTPLNAIMGFSEMMTERTFGPLGDPHYEGYANDIQDSGSLLLSLIDDILDLSKIEAGKYQLTEDNLNIADSAQASVKMFAKQAKDKKIHLANTCTPDLPRLRGDRKTISQIFNNLLSNAIKFTPQGGKVCINAWKGEDNALNIEISDTGIGMLKEDIQKAMNPFEQIDSAYSRKHQGTGLGLHLSHRLVHLHDGKMIVESQINRGTTVTLNFPPKRVVMGS